MEFQLEGLPDLGSPVPPALNVQQGRQGLLSASQELSKKVCQSCECQTF